MTYCLIPLHNNAPTHYIMLKLCYRGFAGKSLHILYTVQISTRAISMFLKTWRKTFVIIDFLRTKACIPGQNNGSVSNHKHFFMKFLDRPLSQCNKFTNEYGAYFENIKHFMSFSFNCPLDILRTYLTLFSCILFFYKWIYLFCLTLYLYIYYT